MNILLTNDDGIDAKGIKIIEEVLKEYGEVYVSAPNVQQSGKSCSLNCYLGCKAIKTDDRHLMVYGSPADCVELGQVVFNVKFDLVVSGCNNGYNACNDVIYSGTCGACLQSLLSSIPAIAFSAESHSDFLYVKEKAKIVLDYIFKHHLLSEDYFLNVNFGLSENDNEIVFTNLANRKDEKYYIISQDGDYYVINRCDETFVKDAFSDIEIIGQGKISITPVSNSYFHEKDLENLRQKVLE